MYIYCVHPAKENLGRKMYRRIERTPSELQWLNWTLPSLWPTMYICEYFSVQNEPLLCIKFRFEHYKKILVLAVRRQSQTTTIEIFIT